MTPPTCNHCENEPVKDWFERDGSYLCEECRMLCIDCMREPMIGEYETGEEGITQDRPATMIDELCEKCRAKEDFLNIGKRMKSEGIKRLELDEKRRIHLPSFGLLAHNKEWLVENMGKIKAAFERELLKKAA